MAGGWDKSPIEFIQVIEKDLVDRRAEIAIDAIQMIVHGSPVDTGAYKGSHRITVDIGDFSTEPLFDKGGGQVLASGMKIIAAAKKPFSMLIIQNNLPYSKKLEDGHSGQAPSGIYGPAYATLAAKYGGSSR